MKNQVFCSRKGGATIKGEFYPIRASNILALELERASNKKESRDTYTSPLNVYNRSLKAAGLNCRLHPTKGYKVK